MAYDLDQFCADCQQALRAEPGTAGREIVRRKLEQLLANPEFVEAYTGAAATIGTHKLYEDPDLEFVVLAHINDQARSSPPHDHGRSWAVYGQASEYTEMTEFSRVDGGQGAGEAKLEQVCQYRLTPGKAGLYDVGAIHAIDYPDNARFVRVTGRDLDKEPRLLFDSGKAKVIENASARS